MTLTLQSRIEEETKKIIRALNNVDASGQKAQQALDLVKHAVDGMMGNIGSEAATKNIKDFFNALNHAGAPDKDLAKINAGFHNILDAIEVAKEKGVSSIQIFANGISKSANDADNALRKLSSIINDLSTTGGAGLKALGVGATDSIRQSLSTLMHYKTALEQISANGGVHPVTGQVSADITRSAAYRKAIDDAKTYYAQIQDATKKATEEERRNQQIVENILNQRAQARQAAAARAAAAEEAAAREAVAEVNAVLKAKREAAAQTERLEKQRQDEIAIAAKRYDTLGNMLRKLRREFSRGISIGADTSKAEEAIHSLITQMRLLRQIKKELESPIGVSSISHGWQSSLGAVGGFGTKHDQVVASRLLEDQRSINAAQEQANRKVQEGVDIEKKRQQEIVASAAKVRNDLASAFSGANAEARKMQSIVGDIKSLFLQGGIVFGAQQFFNSIVQTGGEIVQQHIALRSILGDVQKADELFSQTQQLALQSPFKFGELNRDVKQLAAFGVEADDLYDTTKRLADIASGLGVSFERLGLAYGQVKARSWLDGKELRQFAYAGLPLLQKITELYNQEGKNGRNNYTASEVKGMITKREVSFEDVQKVLWKMTDEGGQFYNMQYVLSDTLLGRWNKLIDAWDIMLGKFADGKGVIGGTFTFIIDRVTDLVLALDKLSPVALAVGGIFAGKKIYSAISSKFGIGSNLTALQAEQQAKMRTYAIEQRQLMIEGQISRQKMNQNLSEYRSQLNSRLNVRNAVEQAAMEGRLSMLKLQKAYAEGLVTPQLLKQLVIMGEITAKQQQMILNGSRFGLVMQAAGSKIKAAFTAIGGWWTIGIGAVLGLWTSISGEMDAIKQKAESLRDPNSERMKPYYDILSQDKASNDVELKKQVESMKELLVKSNAYTKTIDEQITKAKSLNEQYDILQRGVEKAKNVAAGDADLIAGAIGASGGWHTGNPFNYTVTENVEGMQKAMAAYQLKLSSLDENTKKHMNSVANSFVKVSDRGKTLGEKFRMIVESGAENWGKFSSKMLEWNNHMTSSIYGLFYTSEDVTGTIKGIAEDDVPRIIKFLQQKTGQYGDDFKRLCMEQPGRFRTMLEEILGSATVLVPEINKKLHELTGLTFNGKNASPESTPLNSIQRRVFANLGFNRKAYDKLAPYLTDGSYYESKNNIKNELQGLYNEYKSRLNGGATKQEISSAKASYDALWNIAKKGIGYTFVPEDKKSNKSPKDSAKNKADQEARKADQASLKSLQARLKLIKDAYSMYKQYYDKLHDEVAAAKVVAGKFRGQGLSNNDITKIMSEDGLRSLMSDYVARVRKWVPRQKSEMKDNKDSAIAEGVREINDIDFRKMTEGMSDFSSSVDKSLKEMDRRWKSYQGFLKATGNPAFSASASGLSSDSNSVYRKGFEGLYSDYLRDYISGISPHVGGISAAKLKTMSDEDIKKFLGSVFADSDPKKIDGLTSALKKLRDTIVDTEMQDAVNAYISMIGKAVDEASVAGRANGEYETTRTNLDNALSTGIIDKASHDAAVRIAEAVRDNEILKSTASYAALSSYANGMADDTFEKAYEGALKNLKQQLDANTISSTQYASELKKLDDIQKKRARSGIFGGNSSKAEFLKGGLPGLLGYYNDNANARRVYLKGQGLSAEDIENDDIVKKNTKLASNVDELITEFGSLGSCIEAINGVFNGLQQATQSLSEMFDALGNEYMANFFSDTSDAISAVGSVFSPVGDIVKSATSGDIGGVVSNAISAPIKIFTNPITAFAKLHDKKLDRQIKELERANKNIENVRNSIDRNLQNTLGGIYAYRSKQKDANATGSFEYYDQMYASYEQQLANLQARRDKEDRKKKTDKGQLADYDAQIDELSDKINTLAKDMANSIYGIDVKSWAKELTDTLVEAWASGENAAEAYGDKVRDIMKSVAKNMLSQMYIEQYFQPIEDLIEQRMKERKGKLLPEDIASFAQSLMDASSLATDAIDQTLEYWKSHGLDLSNSNSSSMTSSIKSITENTADILASYINAMRADVSVLRQVQGLYLPKLDVTTQAQLQQLTMISENTLRNADAAVSIQTSVSDMRDMINRAQNNTKPFYVYVK